MTAEILDRCNVIASVHNKFRHIHIHTRKKSSRLLHGGLRAQNIPKSKKEKSNSSTRVQHYRRADVAPNESKEIKEDGDSKSTVGQVQHDPPVLHAISSLY